MFDFLKHLIYVKAPLLAVAVIPLLLSGCVFEDSPCPDDPARDGTWVSMRVVNAGATPGRTRADDDAGHPDEPGTDPENYISGDDMALMLFDDSRRLRHVFNPEEYTVQPIDGGDGYILHFRLNSDYFSYAPSMSNVTFSLMAVANRTGLDQPAASFGPELLSLTPREIALGYPSFEMPSQHDAPWLPNSGNNRIPMSGIATFADKDLSVSNTADTPLDLGTVNMQRNLCKVRVLADLQGAGGSDYYRIISAKVTGVKEGAFIPVVPEGNGSWYEATKVVETPTVRKQWCDDTDDVAMHAFPQTSVIYNKTYENAFYCYVPEADLKDGKAMLTITANLKSDLAQTKTWEIPLARAYGSDYHGLSSLVRNHIYEFLIQAVSGAPLTLTLNVADWEAQTVNWDYSENPAVADGGWLSWPDLNGASLPSVARLVFGNDQERPATGSFRFSQPVGGTWTASFAPLGNTEADAFCFVDSEGNLLDSFSGQIADGVTSQIRIRPRYAPASQRSALLVFTVRTPDGRTLSGDLVEAEGIQHFTVVQNSK